MDLHAIVFPKATDQVRVDHKPDSHSFPVSVNIGGTFTLCLNETQARDLHAQLEHVLVCIEVEQGLWDFAGARADDL